MRVPFLPTELWPLAPAFHVANTIQCPKHADQSVRENDGVFVKPQGQAEFDEYADFRRRTLEADPTVQFAVNGCWRCNVEAGGRVV